jgi:Tol biopolymer transport system component
VKPVRGGLLLAVGVVSLLAILPATSLAAFPGRNGLIAYAGSERSSAAEHSEIFTIPPSGGDPTRLTNNGLLDTQPSWSADGRRIVFVRGQYAKTAIWTMRANGRHQHEIIRLGDQRTPYPVEPSFSPSGGRVVFGLRHSIATVGIHGNDLRQLVFGWRGPGAVRSPEYSPDGKRIAFAGRPGRRDVRTSIWTMDRNGSHLRRLTRPPQTHGYGVDDSPDWRPDGRRIEFLYCYDERCGGGLYSVRSDGSDRRPLVSSSYPGVYSPSRRRVALYSLGYDSVHQNVKCGDIFNVTVPRRPWQPPVPSITHNCGADPIRTRFTGLAADPSWQPIPGS